MSSQEPRLSQMDLSYPLRWRVRSVLYGTHRASGHSDSGNFKGFQAFNRHPDLRRLDLRRSLRDPFGQWYVKDYEPRTPVQLYILIDASASMRATGNPQPLQIAAELSAALSQAAYHNGDALNIYVCGEQVELQSAHNGQGARASSAQHIYQYLQQSTAQAASAQALLHASHRLGTRRSLVFIFSDFMFSLTHTEQMLQALRRHDVIPVVMDTQAIEHLPSWGLSRWYDAESGQNRLMWMRPKLAQQWRIQQSARQDSLNQLLLRYSMQPFRPIQADWAAAFARHLVER